MRQANFILMIRNGVSEVSRTDAESCIRSIGKNCSWIIAPHNFVMQYRQRYFEKNNYSVYHILNSIWSNNLTTAAILAWSDQERIKLLR